MNKNIWPLLALGVALVSVGANSAWALEDLPAGGLSQITGNEKTSEDVKAAGDVKAWDVGAALKARFSNFNARVVQANQQARPWCSYGPCMTNGMAARSDTQSAAPDTKNCWRYWGACPAVNEPAAVQAVVPLTPTDFGAGHYAPYETSASLKNSAPSAGDQAAQTANNCWRHWGGCAALNLSVAPKAELAPKTDAQPASETAIRPAPEVALWSNRNSHAMRGCAGSERDCDRIWR